MAKSMAQIAAKYVQRAGAAGADYKAGVSAPARSWQAATSAAANNYAQGVQDAIGNGRFQKGVAAAGDAKWQTNATNIGATRYPQGVAGATAAYQNGFQPYLDALSAISFSPRGPVGSPQNLTRVQQVADTLHRKKIGQ